MNYSISTVWEKNTHSKLALQQKQTIHKTNTEFKLKKNIIKTCKDHSVY